MTMTSSPFTLFVSAAGPEMGFGHLVRVTRIADALGARRELVLAGSTDALGVALRFGWTVHRGRDPIAALDPELVVIDDPSAARRAAWVRRARAAGIPVAVLEDGRETSSNADLVIDGSVASRPSATETRLAGAPFAIVDPAIAGLRKRPGRTNGRVLVALGGGVHVRRRGAAIARAIVEAVPHAHVDVAAGFSEVRRLPALPAGCRWITAPNGLARQLARSSVAVVAGGITLLEACALGRPTVALAVVPAQRRAIRAAIAARAAIGTLVPDVRANIRHAAGAVAELLSSPSEAHALGARAGRLIDGFGAVRVARCLADLASGRAGERRPNAA
jgi:spore coat polysaccharide biosynthesis predicted glycosyltransferase SpsG